MVGTPGSEVARVRSIAASVCAASKRGSITISPPLQHGAVEDAGVGEDVEQRQHAHDPVRRLRLGIERLHLARIGAKGSGG